MTYEWKDHTAEVELVVTADTAEQVFAEAVDAFGRLIELDTDGQPTAHRVDLEGRDNGALLVGLLEELVYLADTDAFVPDAVDVTLAGTRLSAELRGRRTAVQPIVKAATYHNLTFEPADSGWRASVVLDV